MIRRAQIKGHPWQEGPFCFWGLNSHTILYGPYPKFLIALKSQNQTALIKKSANLRLDGQIRSLSDSLLQKE